MNSGSLRSRQQLRPFAIGILVLIGLVVLGVISLNRPAPIDSYRLINDTTISVSTVTGPGTWTRLTGVSETNTSVEVSVDSLSLPAAGTGDKTIELTVPLSAPLNGRIVIDGHSGREVARVE